ncbi:MAG: hypothetical protein ACP5TY_08825 [Thermodesulforhabdaceae bacterium]
MKFKMVVLASSVASFVFLMSSISTLKAVADDGAKALFESKCSVCHSIDKPKSKKKSQEEWRTTVFRMKAKPKASISDEEAAKIIDYLATYYGKDQ